MATNHGKNTVLTAGGHDFSPFCDNSELTRGADAVDNTGYGLDDKVFDGNLGEHDFTAGGKYSTDAVNGPRALFKGKQGTKFAIIRRPEGTGVGKPQESFTALLLSYTETAPVADYQKWATKWKVSGPITDTTQ